MEKICVILALIFSCLLIEPGFIYSQEDAPESTYYLFEDLNPTLGPDRVNIGSVGTIDIPGEFMYFGSEDTKTLMNRMGNPLSNTELGIIADTGFTWYVLFDFVETGYVPDDEKDELDADAMLESIKSSNDKSNELRVQRGFSKLTIKGWALKPRYNDITHNLEWAINGESEGYPIINHSTRLLGRRGVMGLTLVVDPLFYKSVSKLYSKIIDTYDFQAGQKYAEYREGDKTAEYGLTALVVGGGTAIAAKSGLLKYLWKILVGVFIAVSSFFKKLKAKLFKKKTVNSDPE